MAAEKLVNNAADKQNNYQKVSIVILNWNGKNDTIECLESLKKVQYPYCGIILVDNGSKDGSPEYFEKEYPEITLIKNKENLGFTAGNNVGIKKALENGADYILLLNNDTIVDEQLIRGCLEPFLKDKNVGLVGPKVVYYNHPENVWCAGCSYNPLLGRAVMYGTFSKKKDFDKEEIVDWISFCVVMIKREVFEKIGYLDDDFFSSYEDLDFCFRAKKRGYLCAYTPKTIVKHKIAQDWGGLDNPLYIYYQVRNALLCARKNRKGIGFLLFFMSYFSVSMPRRAYRLLQQNNGNRIKYMYMALYDFIKGRYQKGILSEKIREEEKERKRRETGQPFLRIGINTRYLQRRMSGIERYIFELILELQKIDTKNKYFLFFNKDAPIPKIPKAENTTIVVSEFPTKQRLLRIFWEHIFLLYEIKKNKIDVFHGASFFVPIWKPKDCKYIITVHDITFVKYPETFTLGTRLYYKFLFPRSLQLAEKIITDSESTKIDLIGSYHIDKNKIQVIYLGISETFLKKYEGKRREEVKERYNLPEKYVLFTGVLSPRKNVERMLSAFAELLKEERYRNYSFVVLGRKGWLYESIFEKIKTLDIMGNVVFHEDVPDADLPEIYKGADLFLFPSLYEGFGLPILEAMASGCPVITSTISSMPEVAGNAALLVDPKNEQELYNAMKQVLEDRQLRNKLIEKGYIQVKKFAWEKTAAETQKEYEKLLEKK